MTWNLRERRLLAEPVVIKFSGATIYSADRFFLINAEYRTVLTAGAAGVAFAWPVIDGRTDRQPKIEFGFGSMFQT